MTADQDPQMKTTARRATHRRRWVDQAMDAITGTFDLDDAATQAVRNRLEACRDGVVPDGLEVIVDDPIVANWRLKADRDTGGLRLGDYRLYDAPRPDWAAKLDTRLRLLGAPPRA